MNNQFSFEKIHYFQIRKLYHEQNQNQNRTFTRLFHIFHSLSVLQRRTTRNMHR